MPSRPGPVRATRAVPAARPASPRPPASPAGGASRRRRRPLRAVARGVLGVVLFAGVIGGAALGIATWLDRSDTEPQVVRCAATLDGTAWYLDPGQADVTALLAGRALARGLPARALTIAIATGLQESKLENIDYGDRDSLGIFQQRPSQGWGTPEQILDPVYATDAFYDALLRVDGYQDMAITEAAQAVQRSGFPDAYAQHEVRARAWASALYGYSSATVTCTLRDVEDAADPAALVARVQRDLGLRATPVEGGVVVDAMPLGSDPEHAERLGWGVAHWAVAVAEPLGITRVEHAGRVWDRAEGWGYRAGDAEELAPGAVVVGLAG